MSAFEEFTDDLFNALSLCNSVDSIVSIDSCIGDGCGEDKPMNGGDCMDSCQQLAAGMTMSELQVNSSVTPIQKQQQQLQMMNESFKTSTASSISAQKTPSVPPQQQPSQPLSNSKQKSDNSCSSACTNNDSTSNSSSASSNTSSSSVSSTASLNSTNTTNNEESPIGGGASPADSARDENFSSGQKCTACCGDPVTTQAVGRCLSCSALLCRACAMAHKFMICFQGHKVVPIEQAEKKTQAVEELKDNNGGCDNVNWPHGRQSSNDINSSGRLPLKFKSSFDNEDNDGFDCCIDSNASCYCENEPSCAMPAPKQIRQVSSYSKFISVSGNPLSVGASSDNPTSHSLNLSRHQSSDFGVGCPSTSACGTIMKQRLDFRGNEGDDSSYFSGLFEDPANSRFKDFRSDMLGYPVCGGGGGGMPSSLATFTGGDKMIPTGGNGLSSDSSKVFELVSQLEKTECLLQIQNRKAGMAIEEACASFKQHVDTKKQELLKTLQAGYRKHYKQVSSLIRDVQDSYSTGNLDDSSQVLLSYYASVSSLELNYLDFSFDGGAIRKSVEDGLGILKILDITSNGSSTSYSADSAKPMISSDSSGLTSGYESGNFSRSGNSHQFSSSFLDGNLVGHASLAPGCRLPSQQQQDLHSFISSNQSQTGNHSGHMISDNNSIMDGLRLGRVSPPCDLAGAPHWSTDNSTCFWLHDPCWNNDSAGLFCSSQQQQLQQQQHSGYADSLHLNLLSGSSNVMSGASNCSNSKRMPDMVGSLFAASSGSSGIGDEQSRSSLLHGLSPGPATSTLHSRSVFASTTSGSQDSQSSVSDAILPKLHSLAGVSATDFASGHITGTPGGCFCAAATVAAASSRPSSNIRRQKMIYHCKFGEFGGLDGQFTEPSGVAVNIHSDIIVADTNNHRIQVFDKDGRYKFRFGECGKRDGQLLYPNRVAVFKLSGDIVVTERSPTHQVQIFNQHGQFVRKFGSNVLQHPRGVCVDPSGNIIVAECKVMRVFVFDRFGNVISRFNCSKHLEFPNSVCANDKQEIFISDNRAHCIKVFSYDGRLMRTLGGEGITNFPIGVALDSSGNVLVADNHNNFNLTLFTQSGQLLGALESKVKHAQCFDAAIMDSCGSVVLSSKDYHIYVYRYVSSASGTTASSVVMTTPTQFMVDGMIS